MLGVKLDMVPLNEDTTQVITLPAVGRFTVLGKIGQGGMGVLYKAFDPQLNRTIALKFLNQRSSQDPASESRFLNEARAAANLDHPNVCTVYDIGAVGEQVYIAMAYVDGENLKQRAAKGPLPFEEALEISMQIALGLREAHSKGIVHRDIKPSNILITRGGVVKIVDFGLALISTDLGLSREHSSTGTPNYMSPEQVRGDAVDHRSDLWSLGVTLYEAASRSLPFGGGTMPALVRSILYDEVDWTRVRANETLSQFEEVLRRLLAKDRNERYASTDELLSNLKALTTSKVRVSSELSGRCIAVLPFANLNKEEDSEYFSDGLTDELINALAQFEGLRVVSRSSVFAFKGQAVSIKTIGEQLKVPIVLEGSIRSSGNRLRVTVQLTNVADGLNLWSERFDRELRDIFELQDEITLGIVEKLKVKLAPQHRIPAPDVSSTRRLEAYDLYLEGKYNWNRQTEEGFNKAILCFEQASQVDPSFGAANAGLADAYTFLGFHGLAPSLEIFPKARAAATRALDTDQALPDANISMGYVKLYHDWNWKEAEYYLLRAIELNPSSAKAYYSLMLCLVQSARFDQGRVALQKALELDPFNMLYQTSAGWLEYYAKRPRVALEKLDEARALDHTYPELQVALGAASEQLGLFKEAVQHLENAATIYGQHPLVQAFLGSAYAAANQREKALEVLATMDRLAENRFVPSVCRAIVYMALQDTERAFEYLRKAADARDAFLCWLNVLPLSESLRPDPRFTALISEVGFEQGTVSAAEPSSTPFRP